MRIIKQLITRVRIFLGLADGADVELKRIHGSIARIKPPYYKFGNNLVLGGFARDVYLFCKALKPLMDFADRTLAHPDLRVSRLYFDHLIDMEIPPEQLEKKEDFTYEAIKARMENAVIETDEKNAIDGEFGAFMRNVDDLYSSGKINAALYEVERFIDICRHDWERVLGFFDHGFTLSDAAYRPAFQNCPGEQLVPELTDIYCLLDGFKFSEALKARLGYVAARYTKTDTGFQSEKIAKHFAALNKILDYRLTPPVVLAIARLTKRDPLYMPSVQAKPVDYIDQYRKRLVTRYEHDSARIIKEMHESSVAKNIHALFEDIPVLVPEGYNDENDSYVRRESPGGFTHVKAMSILKTFTVAIFENQMKESIKRILVEGYFDNKIFQNNLANIIYQCEKTSARIEAFEEALKGSGRLSMSAVRRYVDEIRHGKDILPFLAKIVNEINQKAKEICHDETGLFAMFGKAVDDILIDHKKPTPDLITNIRNLGGLHNKEMISSIALYKNKLDMFTRVMNGFDPQLQSDGAGKPDTKQV